MEKKTVTKEYLVLSQEDLEKAVSKHFGKGYKVSDMDVYTCDCVPCDNPIPENTGLYFDIRVDGEQGYGDGCVDSYDLWDENEWGEYTFDEVFLPEDCIFGFDTGLFNSYERHVDNSD